MPTFGAWERTVLEHTYDDIDFISAHAYYEEDGDLASFLASATDMDHVINTVVNICDQVRAERQADKRIMVSFDEWNVWYQSGAASQPPTGDDWPVAPTLLEDHKNIADSVVVGSLLITLLRHADRVHAACLAQLVNVIAPIMTEPGGRCWRQTSFDPFAATAKHANGDVLDVAVQCGVHNTKRFGDVADIDAVATWNDKTKEAALFVVNRSIDQPIDLTVELPTSVEVIKAVQLSSPDHTIRATPDDEVHLTPLPTRRTKGIEMTLQPISWSMLRLSLP